MPKIISSYYPHSANHHGINCVQHVQIMWDTRTNFSQATHSPIRAKWAMWGIPQFMHGLYYFCTHRLPTYIRAFLPLLYGQFPTLPTGPINITTTYINKSNTGA